MLHNYQKKVVKPFPIPPTEGMGSEPYVTYHLSSVNMSLGTGRTSHQMAVVSGEGDIEVGGIDSVDA